jgi:Glycosyl hydrolases family 39
MRNFLSKFVPLTVAAAALVGTLPVVTLQTRAIAGSDAGPVATAPIGIQVNWQQPTGITATSLNYGLNVFQAFDPKTAGRQGNALYQANVESIRPGLIRYHNMQMIQDSTKTTSGWVMNPGGADYRWDRNKIQQAMVGAYRFNPTVMINIPGWPSYLDRNGKLNPDRYEEFAKFCADLVRIVNLEQKEGVKYWEVTNEKDSVYGADMAELGKIYAIAAREMKQVDPTIKVGGPAFMSGYDNAKVSAFLNTAYADLDFMSYHTYSIGKEATSVDAIWQSAAGLGSATQAVRRSLSRYSGRSIELFHSEFNISYTPPDPRMMTEISAIYDALALVAITNSGATGSAAWNESDGWYGKMANQWGNWQKRPAAYVHQLFNSQLQGKVMASSSSQPNLVTSFAVANQERSSIALINRSGQDQLVNVQSSGLNTYKGKLFTAYQVDQLGMTTTAVEVDRLSAYRLPANTVTVLTLNP